MYDNRKSVASPSPTLIEALFVMVSFLNMPIRYTKGIMVSSSDFFNEIFPNGKWMVAFGCKEHKMILLILKKEKESRAVFTNHPNRW